MSLLPLACFHSYHSMMARVHSWVYLTNNADADTSLVLNTTGSSKLEYPW